MIKLVVEVEIGSKIYNTTTIKIILIVLALIIFLVNITNSLQKKDFKSWVIVCKLWYKIIIKTKIAIIYIIKIIQKISKQALAMMNK